MSDPPEMPFDIAGKVVWVTGSSRGIGAGVARHLARHGATVVVHGRTDASVADVLAELASTGASSVIGDVRDPTAVAAAVAAIEERHGRLDGVVANVGGAAYGALTDTDPARFAKQFDLNVVSAFTTVRAAQPLLAAARGAAVLISATAAGSSTPMFGAYGAAKAAVEHLARTMAAEWGPDVRVNAVCPGLIRTDGSMTAVFGGSEERAARAGRTTAVGRIGEPADIACACHYLLSEAASFVSGATLVVDGGPTEGPTQRILRAIEDAVKVAVLGAGALGSLYGAWCAEAGHEVVLVGRRAHVDAIERNGLVVRDHSGERTVGLRAVLSARAADDADVVLVACKGQDTAALLAAHEGTPVAAWSVQNGARQAEPLVARYGGAAIGCVSMTGATLELPGVVSHTFAGCTYVGALPTSAGEALDAVVASLGSEVDVQRRRDIVGVLWSKAVLAAAAMGTSVLLRLPYHHVFVEPGARRVFHRLVSESAAVAAAAGVTLVDLPGPLQAGSLLALPADEALSRLAAVGDAMVERGQTAVRVSMLQSVESGRRLEVDAVFAALIDVADQHHLDVPLLRAVTDVAVTIDDVIGRQEGR